MTQHSIVLVGGPDSGKTNYLARLWAALRARQGSLIAPEVPGDIKYVEDALAHLLQGHFAPRTDKALEEGDSFEVPVRASGAQSESFQIVVPDVSGELWKNAVETSELPDQWMDGLKAATGALLFVRVGSDINVEPLDWVTASKLLSHAGGSAQEADADKRAIPTQVALCELLRFMEHALGTESGEIRPRVAILITAWDRLDALSAKKGPIAYLASEYPLLAGRIEDITKFEISVFGVSIVGGDFIDRDFKQQFFTTTLQSSGYVVLESDDGIQTKQDITLPVAWVVQGQP
ncbi:hypothetical protein [Bradyrhizobium genosp. A]|uniref:TRAFAC clade GTPase domain-containing protein n=1 Tax=Bradyrhizobium genosp. A TaxID=83626 RepID=UPI003CF01AC7